MKKAIKSQYLIIITSFSPKSSFIFSNKLCSSFLSTLLILLLQNTYYGLDQFLKLCLLTAIEQKHYDMKYWEDKGDYQLKNTNNVDKNILKNNLKKII